MRACALRSREKLRAQGTQVTQSPPGADRGGEAANTCRTHSQGTPATARVSHPWPGHPHRDQSIAITAMAPQPQPGCPNHGQGTPATARASQPRPGHPSQVQEKPSLQVGAVCRAAVAPGAAPHIPAASSFPQTFPNKAVELEQGWRLCTRGCVTSCSDVMLWQGCPGAMASCAPSLSSPARGV